MSFFRVSLQGLRSCKGTPLHKDRGPFCFRLPSCLTDVVCSCSSSTGLHCFLRTCTFYFFIFIFRLHRPPHIVSSLKAPLCFTVFHLSQLVAQGNVHLYTFHTDSLFSAVLAARAGPAWGAPELAGWVGGWQQVQMENGTECLPAIPSGTTAVVRKLWGHLSPISWIRSRSTNVREVLISLPFYQVSYGACMC